MNLEKCEYKIRPRMDANVLLQSVMACVLYYVVNFVLCEKVNELPERRFAFFKSTVHISNTTISPIVVSPISVFTRSERKVNNIIQIPTSRAVKQTSETTAKPEPSSVENKAMFEGFSKLEIRPQYQWVTSGNSVLFNCSAVASVQDVRVNFTWSFNNKLVLPYEDDNLEEKTSLFILSLFPNKLRYVSVLTIKRASKLYEGEYQCEATSGEKRYKKWAELYINGRKQSAIGERCVRDTDCATSKLTCARGRCQCNARYPVLVKVYSELKCLEDKDYGEKCVNNLQCSYTSPTTECRDSRCRCKPNYDLVEDDYRIHNCYRRASPGEPCDKDVQCEWMSDGDVPLTCVTGMCACPSSYVFVQNSYLIPGCYKKASLFENCEVDEQCTSSNALCSTNGKCMCEYGYRYQKQGCVQSIMESKSKEVFTAAMIAVACLMVAVLGVLLTCIIRRSLCTQRNGNQRNNQGQSRTNDIFTISDEIGALRAVDKPPTYEEVMRREREMFGVPPPVYSDLEASRLSVLSLRVPNNALVSSLPGSSSSYREQDTEATASCTHDSRRPSLPLAQGQECDTHVAEVQVPSSDCERYYDNPSFRPD